MCTTEEKALVERLFLTHYDDQKEPYISAEQWKQDRQLVWRQLNKEWSNNRILVTASTKRFILRFGSIAAGIMLIGGAIWLFQQNQRQRSEQIILAKVKPGSTKAFLTMSGGKTITLRPDRKSLLIGKDALSYNDGLTLHDIQGEINEELLIRTPKGGGYKILLPDGTEVWLNAASAMRCPAGFPNTSREVGVWGEAYFKVKQSTEKWAEKPFIVKCSGQRIFVLGTEFNVYGYGTKEKVRTTLIKGRVKVVSTNSDTLQPLMLNAGEELQLSKGHFIKKKAMVEEATSWTLNVFKFKETELHDVMNQLSRWYDVDIAYSENIRPMHFYGEISRSETLANVLDMLKESGLKFEIAEKEGRINITVLP